MKPATCDIAVIGAGIVGTACALGLRQAGFDAHLFERSQTAPANYGGDAIDPRVYAITQASARWLSELGVWPGLHAPRRSPIMGMKVWDRDPDKALNIDAADGDARALGWIVEHGALMHDLASVCESDWLHRGEEIDRIQPQQDAVKLSFSDGAQLQVRLLVGAEGADSRVREAADIDVVNWRYDAEAVVAHLTTSIDHQGLAVQRFFAGGAAALLPLHDGRRSLVWSTDQSQAKALRALDSNRFCRAVEDLFQSQAGTISEPTKRLSFPLQLLHANQYVGTRCALIGDSAHVIHPLAGQGLNLGLADAANLVRTLQQAKLNRRDWSSDRNLRRYNRATVAQNVEMLALTDALGRAWSAKLPGLKPLLHQGLHGVDRSQALKRLLAHRASGT